MHLGNQVIVKRGGISRFEKRPRFFFPLLFACLIFCQSILSKTRETGPTAPQGRDAKAELQELTLGQVVARELLKGESDRYRVNLKAGQYLKVVAEPEAVDLNLTLKDPTGRIVIRADWEREGSSELLSAFAEVTGAYQLEVSGVARSWSNPRYSITLVKVGELQSAPHMDQIYVKACQLVWEADILLDQNKDQARREAAEKYQAALPLWNELEAHSAEAHTLVQLGVVNDSLGDSQKALSLTEKALALWRTLKNHKSDEAVTLHNWATIQGAGGRVGEALEAQRKVLELRRQLGDVAGQALALNNMGRAYYVQSDFQSMLECYEKALPLARESGITSIEAMILSNIGAVHFSLGEFQKALDYSEQVLPLRRSSGDRRGEAITLTNLGSIYRELGEPEKSLEYYDQALPLMHSVGDPRSEASILDLVGVTYFALSKYRKALEYHEQALSITRMMNERLAEGTQLANIGNAYARLGEPQKALEYFEQSLGVRRSLGDRRGEAVTLQNAGELYRELGDLSKAMDYFNRGLELSRAIKNRFFEANLLYAIARTENQTGHVAEARRDVELAIDIVESSRAKVADADLRASFFASKQDFYEFEIELLMQSYANTQDHNLLAKAFDLSERARARTFLDSLEATRGNLQKGIAPDLRNRERALRARLNTLAEEQIRLLNGKHKVEDESPLMKKIQDTTTDYDQVLAEIRSSNQHYAALTQPQPLSLSEIQYRVLDQDTLLLEYALGADHSYAWAVTNDSITGVRLPSRSELEGLARRAYELMTARNSVVEFERAEERKARIQKADSEYQQVAAKLSDIFLRPILNHSTKKRLLIVSDGALQYLSFAALALPNNSSAEARTSAYVPLISKYEIVNLPSASTLGVLRTELGGRKAAPKAIAVLADPVFDKTDDRVKRVKETAKVKFPTQDKKPPNDTKTDKELTRSLKDFVATDTEALFPLPRLRFTRQEADTISALAPANERTEAVDFAANLATALDPQLSQYRYVHFATHALLNNSHPELSGIVLSLVDESGKDQKGFLLANEIYNLSFPAELVVLSGCKTGLGKQIKGEGIVSLTRSFMYAGAARVVVSLWDVNDRSTAELMTQFYRNILGRRRLAPAAALREAQVTMSKSDRWRAPYYWAAFVLQGEYH